MAKILNREAILKADDTEIREVHTPEWGGTVLVRGMTGRERDQWEASVYKQRGNSIQLNMRNARAKLVALCVVNDKGERIFSDDDVLVLGNKSAKALDRIFAVAQDLSGISKEDMEDLTKNSEETAFDDSFSD